MSNLHTVRSGTTGRPDLPAAHPRFELKYRTTDRMASEIGAAASFHLQPDPYSRDGEYRVNSLYFDTPDNRDAQETDEGVILRSKVRLRCYHRTPRSPFFLELKQRFGSSIYKTRAALSSEDAKRLTNGEPLVDAYRGDADTTELDLIREVIDSREMTPRVWVSYTRTAWTSPWGDGVRMTLDHKLETQAVSGGDPLQPAIGGWWFPEWDDRIVLEFKFFGSAPRWMQHLAHQLALEQTSCSKYGICQESTNTTGGFPGLAEAS